MEVINTILIISLFLFIAIIYAAQDQKIKELQVEISRLKQSITLNENAVNEALNYALKVSNRADETIRYAQSTLEQARAYGMKTTANALTGRTRTF
jgi:archaellum component FlaF (FlaF/FlaG flagellin family)